MYPIKDVGNDVVSGALILESAVEEKQNSNRAGLCAPNRVGSIVVGIEVVRIILIAMDVDQQAGHIDLSP
jgi:hypothetical protein